MALVASLADLSVAFLCFHALDGRGVVGEAVGPALNGLNDGVLDLLGVVGELLLGLETSLLEEGLDFILVAELHLLELEALITEEGDDAVNVDIDALEGVTEHGAEVGRAVCDVASVRDLRVPPPSFVVAATVIADVLASRQVSKDEAVIIGEPVIYILDIGVTPVTLGSDVGSDKSASDERFHFVYSLKRKIFLIINFDRKRAI